MNFIKFIFKNYLKVVLSISFLIIFSTAINAFAANPWPYAPGAVLNPACPPTDPTCIVNPFVTVANGGTGLSTLGTAGQILGINSIADALEYKTIDFLNGSFPGFSVDSSVDGTLTFKFPFANSSFTSGLVSSDSQTFAGTKTFITSPIVPAIPVNPTDAVGKIYVDSFAIGLTWKAPVISKDVSDPSTLTPSLNERYIVGPSAIGAWAGWDDHIVTYNGAIWIDSPGAPTTGDAVLTTNNNKAWTYDGSSWIQFNASQTYVANLGGGLEIVSGNEFKISDGGVTNSMLAGVIPINKGGTGISASGADGNILTSSGGVWVSQAPVGGNGWSIIGNSGTVDGTNFIGTTDNTALNFKVNNQKAGRIDPTLENTFLGYQAGNSNTTGTKNVAIGHLALYSNTIGSSITANGYKALFSNISGTGNTADGYASLYSNTSGINNTSSGANSLRYNTTGSNNSAHGLSALTSNTIGNNNTAVGKDSLYTNTTGSNNTANGLASLYANTIGVQNVGFGLNSLYSNTEGNYNTAVGYQAGYGNSTGSSNVFLGYKAGYSETGSNKLYIANSSTNPPLIYGDFSTGNVGIGTTTPTGSLNLAKTTTYAHLVIDTYSATNTERSKITFSKSHQNTIGNTATVTTEDLGSLVWLGNSGSGVSNAAQLKVRQNGTASTLTPADMSFWTSDGTTLTERMTILPSGSVGIGETSPVQKLQIKGNIGTPTFLYLYNNDYATGGSGFYMGTGASSGNTYSLLQAFKAGNTLGTDFVINQYGGNVGIGTATPESILNISSNTSSQVVVDTYSGTTLAQPMLYFRRAGGTQASPSNVLSGMLLGQVAFSGYGTGDGWGAGSYANIIANATENWTTTNRGTSMSFSTAPNGSATKINRLFIGNDGKIGMGTVTPTSKLQVVGLVEYTDNAAALTGGLTVGAFYRTGDLLKVVH